MLGSSPWIEHVEQDLMKLVQFIYTFDIWLELYHKKKNLMGLCVDP